MDIEKLITIAQKCNQLDLSERLQDLGSELEMSNAKIMLPLVGEFSAGKTTLINALSDSKSLETASKATTAVIYQIFFSQEICEAIVYDKNGNQEVISDISSIKNDKLQDNAVMVQIFDTNDKIPASTIIVDTPGLSSMESAHKQALNDFLPNADAILLVTDVNQGLTRSLVDFAKQNVISQRPMYLVITKSDTKTDKEVEELKEYIKSNCDGLGIKKIVCVSAKENNLTELYDLIAEIDKNKLEILKQVNNQRINNIAKILMQRIDELLAVTNDDESLSELIANEQRHLNRLQRNIDRLIDDTKSDIEDVQHDISNEFCDAAQSNLFQLASTKGIDLNQAFQDSINSLSAQSFNKFKNRIRNTLTEIANKKLGTEDEINLQSLQELNLEDAGDIHIDSTMDLNSIGHQYDKGIGIGVGVIGTVAGVIGILACPTTIAIGGTTVLGEGAVNAVGLGGMALSKLNKMKKASSMAKTLTTVKTIASGAGAALDATRQATESYQEKYKGPISTLVPKLTELFAKPQRQRAINDFLHNTLIPSFESQLSLISNQLLAKIQNQLNEEAHWTVDQKKNNLEMLMKQKADQAETYKAKLDEYTQYKNEIAQIIK